MTRGRRIRGRSQSRLCTTNPTMCGCLPPSPVTRHSRLSRPACSPPDRASFALFVPDPPAHETASLRVRASDDRIACGTGWLFLFRRRTRADDGRYLACRRTVGPLPARAVDLPLLADGPITTACQVPTRWSGRGFRLCFFLLTLMKTARGLGLLRGFGEFLRNIFRQRGWYEDRRTLQITASIAVAVVVMVSVLWGMLWAWHYIKRYRLAIGFAGLTVGFGIIRFISLHEVDAWNVSAPWARTALISSPLLGYRRWQSPGSAS